MEIVYLIICANYLFKFIYYLYWPIGENTTIDQTSSVITVHS